MLKIYGNSFSGPCNKVRYACNAVGAAHEWVALDFSKGEHKTPEHIARHPAGKLPAIDDDGFVLFESDAICRYVSDKHDGGLLPTGLKARAIMEQWNAFAIQHVGLAFGKVAFNRLVAPKFNLPVDETSLGEGLEWLSRYLPIVDHRLGESAHYGADALSLADLSLVSILDAAEMVEIDLGAHENLVQWRTRMQGEAWWQASR